MTATFFADCPRCNTVKATFDASSAVEIPGRPDSFSTFGACRNCRRASIFNLFNKYNSKSPMDKAFTNNSLNDGFGISLSKPVFSGVAACPEYVPEDIERVFREAGTCFSVGAFDASGAMSRKVLDASTRTLVNVEPQSVDKDHADYISWKQFKDLRLRLDWLFERNKLPNSLKELASCVHQDGNDAAHSLETIGRESALDLQDFTISILETLYTVPGRVAANIQRREQRRATGGPT
ncbi:DUF4145 domain-containing protein [Sphingomonas sp. Leaf10]|uniref:DUF4145 domain-containing protein n=1 Tax=Sphingomonas sp. Leaf10 TaxID=1735676 RepID=UPI000A61CCCC|nr:DUF4145 domain-containing protein [Sphingomonas sp. Leaf10]